MALVFALLVVAGLALVLVAWTAQGRLLARPALRPSRLEPVSILKPLKGADPDLEANLESFFALEHPCFEIVFAIAEPDDPAIPVVTRLISRHPDVPASLVISRRRVGLNPKVDNLALAEGRARHEILLVSDSNVRVEPGYLADLLGHLESGAALVTSLIRGHAESGLGGRVEALQLNTFVMGGVAAWSSVFGKPCVVGKSMMLRRSTLRDIGGWQMLGRYLAEDQVCGEEVAARGGRIAVTGRPVDNRLGSLSLSAMHARHLRWARIRRRLTPAGYAAEILLNPVGVGAIGAVATPTTASCATLGLAWLGMSLLAWSAERRLGRPVSLGEVALLEALRSLVVLAAWPVPFLGTRVTWRGNRLRIARRTLLVPLDESPASASLPEPALETRA